MRVLEFTIPLLTPSLNTYIRMHWRKRKKQKKLLLDEVWLAVPQVQRHAFEGRVALSITRYSTGTLDADNLAGGLKMLIDCLQPSPLGIGLISEDSPDVIAKFEPKQVRVRAPNEHKMIVRITDYMEPTHA